MTAAGPYVPPSTVPQRGRARRLRGSVRMCSEHLVPAQRVPRTAAAQTGDLREVARPGQGGPLVGTHLPPPVVSPVQPYGQPSTRGPSRKTERLDLVQMGFKFVAR